MTPHERAVLNTDNDVTAPIDWRDEVFEMASMVGRSAWKAKDIVPAYRAYSLALAMRPTDADAKNRLGRIELKRGNLEAARHHFYAAWMNAKEPATAINLAITCGRMRRFAAALEYCGEALELDPAFLPAYIQKAAIFEELSYLADAEATVSLGLVEHPNHPELLYALSLYELMRGDFDNGWRHYEHRGPRLELCQKLDEYLEWQGEPLDGKTILVCGEQGIGDQIMFARYVPLLKELGAHVVFNTRPELARLFELLADEIVTSDRELQSQVEPDYWIALGSLPLRWRQFESIDVVGTPNAHGTNLPYLWARPEDIRRFEYLMPRNGLRVGLCWQGNPKHRRDEYRSVPFDFFKPLLELSNQGVTFYSLQRGHDVSPLLNLTGFCHDLGDTAAAIADLDLVITVDTAMLHLAGAMGKEVWGLIWKPGDWRWGTDRVDTPWYGTATLYRQETQRVWKREIAQMTAGLRTLLAANTRADLRPGWSARSESSNPVETGPCRYGEMAWYHNDHYIGRALELYGEYSQSEVDLLAKLLHPGDTVIDAGANIGALTVPISHLVGDDGLVFAFEPIPNYFALLRRNVKGRDNVREFDQALGSKCGVIELRDVPLYNVHAPGWPGTSVIEAEMRTVDSMGLTWLNLLKIDVDGQELEILQGAEETIARYRPLIYVENDKPESYPDLLPWLQRHGYRLYQHAAPLYNENNARGYRVNVLGSLVSAMLLCVPNERHDLHPGEWGLQRIRLDEEQWNG